MKQKKQRNVGWICPKCGRGMSPAVTACPCTPFSLPASYPFYPIEPGITTGTPMPFPPMIYCGTTWRGQVSDNVARFSC